MKFVYVGSHPTTLANGQPVAMDDVVDLSPDDQKAPHNAMLIEDGHLVGQHRKSDIETEKE